MYFDFYPNIYNEIMYLIHSKTSHTSKMYKDVGQKDFSKAIL